MKIRGLVVLAAALAASTTVSSQASAAELIINGNFSNGLTGWAAYTTSNGTVGTPTATTFDVTGDNVADTAARLQVGEVSYDNVQRGGGLFQQFTLAEAGSVDFSVAFASRAPNQNLSGGRFSLLIDGVEGAAFDTAGMAAGTTKLGTLSFSSVLSSGVHTYSLQATRPYITDGGTPFQYFTNASARTMSAVPEPASWTIMIVGFGAVGGAMRKRKSKVTTTVAYA